MFSLEPHKPCNFLKVHEWPRDKVCPHQKNSKPHSTFYK